MLWAAYPGARSTLPRSFVSPAAGWDLASFMGDQLQKGKGGDGAKAEASKPPASRATPPTPATPKPLGAPTPALEFMQWVRATAANAAEILRLV